MHVLSSQFQLPHRVSSPIAFAASLETPSTASEIPRVAKGRTRRNRRKQMRFHRQTRPGAAPGIVQVAPEAPAPQIRVLAYGQDQWFEAPVTDLDSLPQFVDKYSVTWIDISGLGDAATIRRLGDLFGLHPLALEDVVNVHQRAKVEAYDDVTFIVARMPQLNDSRFDSEQLSLFVRPKLIISFQERVGDCFDSIRERARRNLGRARQGGSDYLLYAMLDAVIDAYFPIVDHFAERLDELEDALGQGPRHDGLHRIHDTRRELLLVRRAIRPHRDALNELIRDQPTGMSPETLFFLRDCSDHAVQLIELIEVYREICTDLRDYQLSLLSNRMNEVMKVLTVIATIFMPLSFIAGVYGMNFDTSSPYNMPELGWRYGYLAAITLMAVTAGGMLYGFASRGWIRLPWNKQEPLGS